VDESCSLNFYDDGEQNLVVAAGNMLSVYRIRSSVDEAGNHVDRFELCDEFELWGIVVSMARLRLAGSVRDSLLLSIEESKCVIVEYEPDTGSLSTISMHFFQDEDLRRGFRKLSSMALARVDGFNRCAAVLVYGSYLAVLPFRRSTGRDMSGQRHQAVSSFMIDLQSLPVKIASVLDFQFLEGYNDPTILLLYEALPTWTGRVTERQDTCGMVALSINLIDETHPVIWQMAGLPYDSCALFPIPKPLGGSLLFAANSLIYLDQSVPPYGVALNSLPLGCTNFALKTQDVAPLNLQNCKACMLSDDSICVSLETGDVYIITLKKDSLNNVRRFFLDQVASSVIPTTLSKLSDNLIFLGSRLGNSLLLRYKSKENSKKSSTSDALENGREDGVETENKEEREKNELNFEVEKSSENGSPENKRKRMSSTAAEWENCVQSNGIVPKRNKTIFELEEDELSAIDGYYGDEIFNLDVNTSYDFETMDNLSNIGPCGPVELIHTTSHNDNYDHVGSDARDRNIDVCVLSGKDKTGSITVLHKSVRPSVASQFPFPMNFNDMWTLRRSEDETHSLLVMTKKDQTMVFQTGAILEELKKEECGLATNAKTIFCSTIGNGKYIVQVLPRAVVLVDMDTQETIQNKPFDLSGQIVQAVACDPFVVILASKGTIISLVLSENSDGSVMLKTSNAPECKNQDDPEKKIMHISLFKDTEGHFVLAKGRPEKVRNQETQKENQKNSEKKEKQSEASVTQHGEDENREEFHLDFNTILTAEEEDELLYGDLEEPTADSGADF
jgi:cleavage and polyadenylation specificity factor subunit 1